MNKGWLQAKLLNLAYLPAGSDWYIGFKHRIFRLLNDEHYSYNRYFDRFMIFLVLATSIEYVYDTGKTLSAAALIFEYVAIAIFTLEYLLRFWVSGDVNKLYISMYEESVELNQQFVIKDFLVAAIKQKIQFMVQPMSIIDLLAIYPELRPLRLLKLFRYFESTGYLVTVFRDKKYEITLLSMIIVMTLSISSAMFYKYEYTNEKIHGYFDSFYWAVITMGTVGYGDITPDTTIGKVISILLVFSGLSILAMFTSIITTGLEKKISESKERDSYKVLNKLDSYMVIIGYSKIGAELANKLRDAHESYIVLDIKETKVDRAKSHGHLAFVFDGTHTATYHALGLGKKIKAVMALTKGDLTNLSIVLTVRSISRTIFIIAKANDINNKDKFLLAKADEVISRKMGAKMLSEFVNNPIAFEAMSGLVQSDKKIIVEEILIGDISNQNGYITAEQIDFELFSVLVIGVFRNTKAVDETFDFNPQTARLVLRKHDTLIVTGRPKNIEGLRLKILKVSSL